MLVLSRKAGEEIMIGDNIRLVITRISGNRVTVGIAAPKMVQITRRELESEAVGQIATPEETLLAVTCPRKQ
jgi:carbon storage regulator